MAEAEGFDALIVDAAAGQSPWKLSVRAAASTNVAELSGLKNIDGVSLAAGDRVLVAAQTDPKHNGIYVVSDAAWKRAIDMADDDQIKLGTCVWVRSGTAHANTLWVLTSPTTGDIRVGVTSLTFSRFQITATDASGDVLNLTTRRYINLVLAGAGERAQFDLDDAFKFTLDDSLASFKFGWLQSTSGTGRNTEFEGQQARIGSSGGNVILRVGKGGTPGVDPAGDFEFDFGQAAGGTPYSGHGKFFAGAVQWLNWRFTTSGFGSAILNAGAFGDKTYVLQLEALQINLDTNGSPIVCNPFNSGTLLGGLYAEVRGQLSSEVDVMDYAPTLTFDRNASMHHRVLLTGNVTSVDLSNVREGSEFTLEFIQDTTGGRTVTGWAAKFEFVDGLASTVDGTAGKRTTFYCRARTTTSIEVYARTTK